MADAYVTLNEAAELEAIGYETMKKRIHRNPEKFLITKEQRETGGKEMIMVAISSLSKKARTAWKEREKLKAVAEADQIEGTTNVYKDTAELLVATELADKPDAWFLLCTNKFLKPFIFQKRKPVELTALTRNNDENVFMRDEFVWGADGRSNAGYGFWQMAYGSDGTARG